MKKFIQVFSVGLLMVIGGCASLPTEPEYVTRKKVVISPRNIQNGVYHKVGRGETLWRIAKSYNLSIEQIIRANNIPNAAKVERNQLIFIPGASGVKNVLIESVDQKKEFVWPVEGKIVKYFKDKRGLRKSSGIDIKVQNGSQVKASRTGRVVFADYLSGYNQTVILDHEDGFYSVYAQNAKLLVGLGEYIFKNAPISVVGTNGKKLAYLHFEIRKKSIEDNPLYYLP